MKKSMSAAFILFCAALIFAQETNKNEALSITVDKAVNLALENNLNLKRSQLTLDLQKKQSDFAWGSVSPSASLSGSYSVPFTDDKTYDSSMSASASLSLSLTPSIYTTIRAAKLNYANGLETYENAKKTIELNVRKLFYSLLYTKESLSLQERNLETAKQRYLLNKDKYELGKLSELDLLTSQVNYESLKPSLESANIAYENSLDSFKQTLGISQEEQISLDGKLDDFVDEKINEKYFTYDIENVPSVKTIKNSITSAENTLLASRFSAWGPSLSVSYTYGLGKMTNVKGTATDSDSTTNALTLSARIPLDGYLPWSSGALSIESQKTNLADLNLQLENQKTSVEIDVKNGIKKINQAQSQLDSLKNNVDLAQRSYDMTLTAYNHGSKDLLTLQNAADSLLSSKINLQSQYYTLACALLDLENTLGLPFGTLTTPEAESQSK